MECPKPQPGHQLKPNNFKGQSVKCFSAVGFAMAKAESPATQKTSSKYFEINCLINFIVIVGEQCRYAQRI